MPRQRSPQNSGLPLRWKFHHGAYYYQVPPGKESLWDGKRKFRLGATLPEAYKEWARRIEQVGNARTIGDLLSRYMLEVVPTKAISTQGHNQTAVKPLLAAFRDMLLADLEPQHIYQYIDRRPGKVGARREIEILSHAFTKAVEWGYMRRHPFKGETRLPGEKSRTRYIEDWEIVECLALMPRRKVGSVLAVQAYIRITLLTGLRRGDLLRLSDENMLDDGIHVMPAKTERTTKKRLIVAWTDELRAAVNMALAARPNMHSKFLFCNRDGACYLNEETGRAGGWDTMWRNFFARVLKETKVEEHFTEHDLRAKCASDAETLEHARLLMSHADSRITQRVYRRKPEIIQPLR